MIENLTHREFVVLINLSFVHYPGKLEVVHVVAFIESKRKCQAKHYNEAEEITEKAKKTQRDKYLVICSRMFFL